MLLTSRDFGSCDPHFSMGHAIEILGVWEGGVGFGVMFYFKSY